MTEERGRSFVMPMFTIYDSASDRHEPPMVLPTEDVAKRRFMDMVNTKGTVYFDHPSDFKLCACGAWNLRDGKAEITTGGTPTVCTGLEVKDAT